MSLPDQELSKKLSKDLIFNEKDKNQIGIQRDFDLCELDDWTKEQEVDWALEKNTTFFQGFYKDQDKVQKDYLIHDEESRLYFRKGMSEQTVEKCASFLTDDLSEEIPKYALTKEMPKYALTRKGRFFADNPKRKATFHSQLVNFVKEKDGVKTVATPRVQSAGHFTTNGDGVVVYIDNNSGHYRPKLSQFFLAIHGMVKAKYLPHTFSIGLNRNKDSIDTLDHPSRFFSSLMEDDSIPKETTIITLKLEFNPTKNNYLLTYKDGRNTTIKVSDLEKLCKQDKDTFIQPEEPEVGWDNYFKYSI